MIYQGVWRDNITTSAPSVILSPFSTASVQPLTLSMEPPYTLIPGTSCFIFSLPPEWSLKCKSDTNKNKFTNQYYPSLIQGKLTETWSSEMKNKSIIIIWVKKGKRGIMPVMMSGKNELEMDAMFISSI